MDKLYQIRNGKAEPVNFSWVPGTGPGGSGISDAVGAIRLYNRNNIPDNARVHATNRMYSKAEYPELYAVIGDKYPEYIENKTFKNPVVEEVNHGVYGEQGIHRQQKLTVGSYHLTPVKTGSI